MLCNHLKISIHETNLSQVRKLRENIGSRKKICTVHVVHKEISTQTETTVQRTIKTQTLDNVKDPNRFVSFQISFQYNSRTSHNLQLFLIFNDFFKAQ